MQAKARIQNEIVVVALSGRVDVETAEPFRAASLRELRGKRIVFDFGRLSFVGSQGILPFLETLQALHELAPGSLKFAGVGIEFRRVFGATPLNIIETYETPDQAVSAFDTPVAAPLTAASPVPLESYLSYRPEPLTAAPTSAAALPDDEELGA